MSPDEQIVYTIGHSNHSIGDFLALLEQYGIDILIDVRSVPYSGKFPHFNKASIESAVQHLGLGYAYLGGELGGQPANLALRDASGRVVLDRVAASAPFQIGLSRLIDLSKNRCAALNVRGGESAQMPPLPFDRACPDPAGGGNPAHSGRRFLPAR